MQQSLFYAHIVFAFLHGIQRRCGWSFWWLGLAGLASRQQQSRRHCLRDRRHRDWYTVTWTRHRMHLSCGQADLIHTATPDMTKQSCLCRVWRGDVNWTIAINVFRLHIFCRRQSWVVENPIHTAEADMTQTGLCYWVWPVGVNWQLFWVSESCTAHCCCES